MFKTNLRLGAIAAIGLAVCATSQAQSRDVRSLNRLYDRWNEAFMSHNLKGLESCYARNVFVFDVVPPRDYPDRASYMKDFSEFFKVFSGPIDSKFEDVSFTVVGPVAFSHAVDDVTLTAQDGSKTHLIVRLTDVFRKGADGWKIVQEHVSVPVDLETGKPDLLSKK